MKLKNLFLTLVLAAVSMQAWAQSGTCGDNLTWVLENGTLTIRGTGEMTDYGYYSPTPWTQYRTQITTAVIENGVTKIGVYAFYDCVDLTSVSIGTGVTEIGGYVFSGCRGLTSVTIPNGVTTIGKYAFSVCTGLTSVSIPNSVTEIGDNAFMNCLGLTSVTIPEGVTTVGDNAFDGCSGLTTVNFNATNCTAMGTLWQSANPVFRNCPVLTMLNIGNNVQNIPNHAFAYCAGLTSVTIPESVASIGDRAFQGCTGLTSMTIPNGVTEMQASSFSGCTGLTSITIGTGVTEIGIAVFENCTGLTSVIIPNNVTEIHVSAFDGCTGLTSITIPNSVTTIGSYAFYRTGWYNNQPDGVLYLDNWLICYKGTMPPNTDISILPSTKSIAESAFEKCTGLTSVIIPESVTYIDDSAFAGCKGLTSVIIPDSVTCIGDYIFSSCTGLVSVTIGTGVAAIGDYAFAYCTELAEIHNKCTTPQTIYNKNVFVNVNQQTGTLYVPECAMAAYRSASVWKDFEYIIGKYKCETGIEEVSANEIQIFPNPAAESFRITGIAAATTVIVSDLTGKTVLRQTVNPGEAVSVSRLPQGLYVVSAGGKAVKLKVKN